MVVGVSTDAIEGVATSMILSAISASLSRAMASGVEARTIITLLGYLCRNSSLRKEVSSQDDHPTIAAFA